MPETGTSSQGVFVPKLIPGIQIAPFDSAVRESSYLLTHPNGKRWEITEVLAQTILAIDGQRDSQEIAAHVVRQFEGETTEDEVHSITAFLSRIRVIDDVEAPYEVAPELYVTAPPRRRSSLLIRIPLLSPAVLRPFTAILQYLFLKQVITPLVAAILSVEIWWLLAHFKFIPTSLGRLSVADVTWVTGCVSLSFLIHEFGHAAACRRMGCEHKGIGFGLYLVFPRMYADVTDAWKLPRLKRAIVDVGGVYFQSILAAVLIALYAATHKGKYLIAAGGINFSCLHNLSPFFKLDGYWLVSDLLGVPNLDQQAWRLLKGQSEVWKRFGRKTIAITCVYSIVSTAFMCLILYRVATYFPSLVLQQYPHAAARFWSAARRAWISGDYRSAPMAFYSFALANAAIFGVALLLNRYLKKAVRLIARIARRRRTYDGSPSY